MKNRLIKCGMFLALLVFLGTAAEDQKKATRPAKTRTTAKTTSRNSAANNKALAPAKDTVPAVVEADLKIDEARPSLRNDNAIQRNLVKDRTPLEYEHIREDDATYMQRVWRELDVHEKLNVPFVYKAQGDNGDQRCIMILLNA